MPESDFCTHKIQLVLHIMYFWNIGQQKKIHNFTEFLTTKEWQIVIL